MREWERDGGGGVSAEEWSEEECRWRGVGRKEKEKARLSVDRMDVAGPRWKRNGERAREGRHVTKCILITEQQMSRMELLCCLNSRTLHFSGLTSHRIHLPASCQFRVERVKKKEKEREREREKRGRLTPVRPSPPSACLAERLPFPSLFPRWPVQLVICITTHTSTHCSRRAEGELPLSFGCCTMSRFRLGWKPGTVAQNCVFLMDDEYSRSLVSSCSWFGRSEMNCTSSRQRAPPPFFLFFFH